ncbi:MAG TPA: hypothetical protein VLY04_23580 [Bryobacteraceae bacterium]|nr:hypothetical protein [Bryobacteraceae bacterium]
MPENPWQETTGTPISADEAWRLFDRWKTAGQEIGVLFCGRSASAAISALCTVRVARNGLLQLKGEATGASFNLKQAKFTYGPMQVFPRWPAPPPVEVMALQAYLVTGDWLVLAEGMVPKELSPLTLPM